MTHLDHVRLRPDQIRRHWNYLDRFGVRMIWKDIKFCGHATSDTSFWTNWKTHNFAVTQPLYHLFEHLVIMCTTFIIYHASLPSGYLQIYKSLSGQEQNRNNRLFSGINFIGTQPPA